MPRAKRREREIQRTREDILGAAARVFADKGYQGATMAEIAAEAGYTAPSLYSYFTGKQEIFAGLAHNVLDHTLKVFDAPTPEGLTFEQSLELTLQRGLALCEERRAALRALFTVPNPGGALLDDEVVPGDVVIQAIARSFEENDDGTLVGLTYEQAAECLFSLINVFFTRWLRFGSTGALTELAPLIRDLFLHGVVGRKESEHDKESSS